MTSGRQILLSNEPVPRWSIRVLSVLAHVAALALLMLFLYAARPRIVPTKMIVVEPAGGGGQAAIPPRAKLVLPRLSPVKLPKNARRKHRPERAVGGNGEGEGLQALRGRAAKATEGLMADMKFLHTYGFSTQHYELAIQTSGELPNIAVSELPPRFEQYLIIEVTIDIDGHVADARLISGEATPKIEKKLVSAIREFKYVPAKHNGSPIPSQVDIVVHIPT